MWPLYPLSEEIVTIIATSKFLSCSWIEQTPSQYNLKAYARYPIAQHEIINSIIFNSSYIKRHITEFLNEHGLYHAFAGIACEEDQKTLPPEVIMQYQLLAMSIPLNCIIITSLDSFEPSALPTLQLASRFEELEPEEIIQTIGLFAQIKELL